MKFNIRYNHYTISIPILGKSSDSHYHYIPERCEVIRHFRLITDSFADKVVENTEIFPGLYISRTIVNPQNCYLRILNTNNRAVEIKKILKLETQDLTEFEFVSTDNSTNNRKDEVLKTLAKNIPNHASTKLFDLCSSYSDIFALPSDKHTVNNFYTQSLQLTDNSPVYIKNYRYPNSQKEEIDSQVKHMLNNNIIEPSCSNYNSPIILVPKKSVNGVKKYRLCIDFRELNKKLIPDKYPLPRIDEILDNLGKTKYFTKLDMFSGYFQVPLEKRSKHLTSFSTAQGSFQFNVLPFGLNVAPNSFARMMAIAFSGLDPTSAFLYIDDLIVLGRSEEHHLINLRNVFQTCRDKNLKLNPEKCDFMKPEVIFLGHKCTVQGIYPDNSKFNAIINYPIPKDAEAIKRFIAFCNYYRKFIPNFALISIPLNSLTKKNVTFLWTTECQESFDQLKKALVKPPILRYPDYSKQFILTVDASKQGIGAVLSQISDDNADLPIAYASSSFSKADRNKAPIEQELLAIYYGIKHFRPYLYGTNFLVRSDHKPLSYLFSMKDPTSKLARIRLDLMDYDFTIEYIKGKENVAADALSRLEFDSVKNISNKSILAITRSKTAQGITTDTNLMKNSQRAFITMNNMDVRKLPLITFHIKSSEISFELRGRHLNKSRTLTYNSGNGNSSIAMLFSELDNICLKRSYKETRISHDDEIFTLVDKQEFISLANGNLKNTTIRLMQPIERIDSAYKKLEIIAHFHNHELEGGHTGQRRLYAKIRSKYEWPNMAKEIRKYVKNCQQCRVNKPKVTNKELLTLTETPDRPFESISIDTIGPFQTTTNQAKYAVTIICEFSKYLIIVPIPNKEAKTIANCLMNHCILIFGQIKQIRSDLGTEYVNQLITELLTLLNIRHDRSTAYHHESLGTIERSHKTLNEYLRTYMSNNKDWPKLIKSFEYCYNTTPNTSINLYSPFELVFGKLPPKLINNDDKSKNHVSINDYVNNMKYNLELAYEKTKAFITKNKIRNKIYYDKSAKPIEISVGDNVLLINEIRNKFDPLYKDNFVVKEILDNNVKIENKVNLKTSLVHKNRLRKVP